MVIRPAPTCYTQRVKGDAWQTVLERAAGNAGAELPKLLALIDAAAAGKATRADAAAVFPDGQRAPIVDALDAALRAGRGDREALRTALRVLPGLLLALRPVLTLGKRAPDIAEYLEGLAAPPPHEPESSAWHCPRCGSRMVEEQYTSALGDGRVYELLCHACGLFESFSEGDPAEAAWGA
jgi:hypothetical protein